jgi:hypothetical protein
MTRAQAEKAGADHGLPITRSRSNHFVDVLCDQRGLRVGYGSHLLIAYALHLRVPNAESYRDKVVWISTSSPEFPVDGIVYGDSISGTMARLGTSVLWTKESEGANDWYVGGPWQGASIVVKTAASKDPVQEVGIAIRAVSSGAMSNVFMAGTFY